MKDLAPRAPTVPPRSRLAHGGRADPGGEGIDMKLDELINEWRLMADIYAMDELINERRLMADIYAMAVELDRVRFGSVAFLAAGERLHVTGDYKYNGRLIFQFDDAKQLHKSGSAGCSHEWWHRFNPKQNNQQ